MTHQALLSSLPEDLQTAYQEYEKKMDIRLKTRREADRVKKTELLSDLVDLIEENDLEFGEESEMERDEIGGGGLGDSRPFLGSL